MCFLRNSHPLGHVTLLVGEIQEGWNQTTGHVYSFHLDMVYVPFAHILLVKTQVTKPNEGIPSWRSGLAPAFGPGRDPGDPGSNPTSGSRRMDGIFPSSHCLKGYSVWPPRAD